MLPNELIGKESTINRVSRELKLNKKTRRFQRFQAEHPNELHHIDASSSKFFYVYRETGDGDYILKLHSGMKRYKNKPVPIRLRPWVYGLCDDHSGYFVAKYIVAYGESAADNLEFLQWAWSKTEEKGLFGLPDKLKGDLGPMMRGPAARNLFERLGIDIDSSRPGGKEAHGKIERPWRTNWQRFESTFFACPDCRKFEITLTDLNRRFYNFLEELNDRPHRYEKAITRSQAWQKINYRGGAVAIPENALSTVARRYKRTVGTDGCFSLDGDIYEVKGLFDAKVFVYQGVFEDKLIVEDRKTGVKHEVKEFSPNPIGTYTAHKETPHQKAVKEAETLDVTNTLYTSSKEQGNVTVFPTRIKENREIANPLDTDTYPSLDVAMKEFVSICGFRLDKENREAVQNYILENGLSRRSVIELALESQPDTSKEVDYAR